MDNHNLKGRTNVQWVARILSGAPSPMLWCSSAWWLAWQSLVQMAKSCAGNTKSRLAHAWVWTCPTNCGWCGRSCTAWQRISMLRLIFHLNQSRVTGMVQGATPTFPLSQLVMTPIAPTLKNNSRIWESATNNVVYSMVATIMNAWPVNMKHQVLGSSLTV